MSVVGSILGFVCNGLGFLLIWGWCLEAIEAKYPGEEEQYSNFIASAISALLAFLMVTV